MKSQPQKPKKILNNKPPHPVSRDHPSLGKTLPRGAHHNRRVRMADVLDVDRELDKGDVLVQVGDHLELEVGEGEGGPG